ncbi:hypothetical protein AMJ57_01595 [Parcubacteria bacterium SG8_24]|nr:MAG: hypothetical protein AMJ57_01595 [Parcubacteria bacterium SG8_24]
MSLICSETRKDILFGRPLWAAKPSGGVVGYALSGEVIDRIPLAERQARPGDDTALDIHQASSGRNFNGSYTWSGFRVGGLAFSVSRETAARYLPTLMAHLRSA